MVNNDFTTDTMRLTKTCVPSVVVGRKTDRKTDENFLNIDMDRHNSESCVT